MLCIRTESRDKGDGGWRRGWTSVVYSKGQRRRRGGIEDLGFPPPLLLPGDHGAGLRLNRRGGGGTELREAAVAGLQAGHRTPEDGRQGK